MYIMPIGIMFLLADLRRREMDMDVGARSSDFSEVKAPLILLVVGAVTSIVYGIVAVEDVSVGLSVAGVVLNTALSVAFAIPACIIVAKILGVSFGFLNTAVLKLAALSVFPAAIGMIIPGIGSWVALALYFGLLEWFFELEWWQSIVFVVVLSVLRGLAAMLVVGFIITTL